MSLWQSREVQRNWSTAVVLRIGSLLVEAHARAGHVDRAIELCSTMYYNVRQSRGGAQGESLELAHRLAALLRHVGRAREAIRVHERVLYDLDEAMVDELHHKSVKERMRAAAETHLEGMRRCGWGDRAAAGSALASRQRSTADLYQRLADRYGNGELNVPTIDKWEGKVLENGSGHVEFDTVSWVLHVTDDEKEPKKGRKRDSIGPAKQRWGWWGRKSEVQAAH